MSIKETVQIEEDENGDLFFKLSDKVWKELEEEGWQIGDTLQWDDNKDGSWSITKKEETEWVLVETLSQFKSSYMVEVTKGKTDWAFDTVVMGQAQEFSQEHLLPTDIIINHRVMTKQEALDLCAERNEVPEWSDETKIRNYFTPMKDKQ
jgi:hypothetical protein